MKTLKGETLEPSVSPFCSDGSEDCVKNGANAPRRVSPLMAGKRGDVDGSGG
ncbi:MAG: hypothetical protein J6K20_07340 [Thermoguttaceae bacterium]|nr:hypothetical protein [Thermoguttaceae bacterium]